jgi:Nucleotidyl transferase AbiEii toxin, Type IV TA system
MTRRYASAVDFKQALEQRLRRDATGPEIPRRRQLLVFQRLLARILPGLGRNLVLKGGLALEVRLGGARTTGDIDLVLFGAEATLLERLQALGQLDLGDFMTFEIQPKKATPDVAGDGVRYGGKRFRVEGKLAGKMFGAPFGLDIVFGGHMLGAATAVTGEDYLGFAGIAAPEIHLLPIETHLAEKLHAYTLPRTSPNSRVRDLPDMALLATVADPLHGHRITEAIQQTFRTRGTHDAPAVLPVPPDAWRTAYAALAAEQRLRWKTLEELLTAVRAFVDPVLRGDDCGTWNRDRWSWSDPARPR